ncbi:MAG: MFS transporter [Ignavibacteriaceae bacterium]
MKKKKLAGQVIVLSLVSLFTDIASEMLYPVTPIFLTAVLGSSMAVVGIVEGIAEVTAGILKGYFGNLSDRIGKRSLFVIIGYSLSALSKPLPGIFPSISSVLISRTSDRIGKGIRTAPRDALLAGYSDNNTGAVFGFHRAMDTLGAALGPLAALLLLNIYNEDYQIIFLLAFIPSVVAVFFTMIVKDRPVPVRLRIKTKTLAYLKEAPENYKLILLLFSIFSFVNSSDVFLILKINVQYDSGTLAIGGYILYNIVYASFSYPLGKLSDKKNKRIIFAGGLIVFSIVYTGFALSASVVMFGILFALYGVYAAATEGIMKAWISDIIPDSQRGSAIGLLTMISGIAIMLGSVFAGILWDAFGPEVPFLISAVVSFFIAIFLFIRNI